MIIKVVILLTIKKKVILSLITKKLSTFTLFLDEEYTSKSGARGEMLLNISFPI